MLSIVTIYLSLNRWYRRDCSKCKSQLEIHGSKKIPLALVAISIIERLPTSQRIWVKAQSNLNSFNKSLVTFHPHKSHSNELCKNRAAQIKSEQFIRSSSADERMLPIMAVETTFAITFRNKHCLKQTHITRAICSEFASFGKCVSWRDENSCKSAKFLPSCRCDVTENINSILPELAPTTERK